MGKDAYRSGDVDPASREFTEKVLDRIANDAAFRRRLSENAREAMEEAGFADESQQLLRSLQKSGTIGSVFRPCQDGDTGRCRTSCLGSIVVGY
jgi:hypothetical protein